jgi:hypothetical protein
MNFMLKGMYQFSNGFILNDAYIMKYGIIFQPVLNLAKYVPYPVSPNKSRIIDKTNFIRGLLQTKPRI